MPWTAAVGALVGSVANKALSDGGGGGGGTSGGNAPPVYIPTSQPLADADFLANKDQYGNQLRGIQNTISPYAYQQLNDQFNNGYNNTALINSGWAQADYNRNAQQAEIGSGLGWSLANNAITQAVGQDNLVQSGLANVNNSVNTLYGMGDKSNQNYQGLMDYQRGQLPSIQNSQGNLYGAGNDVLQTAFDPQQALYNRSQQQLTEQNRAAQSARGIQMTPYGAALENSANQNFNIDWQNQQLGRQSQGLNAAQGAYGTAQGLGNSYTGTQAGLQAGQNEQYAGLTNAAQNQYTGYLNAMNQSHLANTQNVGAAQQNAFGLGNQAAQSVYNAGQVGLNTNQQIYNNQNQALQNYAGINQSYLQGLNQLQSNDLGYMNFGQGAQNLGWQQNAYNDLQNQKAIQSISGPLGSLASKGLNNWFAPSGASYLDPNAGQVANDNWAGYGDPGYDGP